MMETPRRPPRRHNSKQRAPTSPASPASNSRGSPSASAAAPTSPSAARTPTEGRRHYRECACGRGMQCIGITQAFRMLGDPRCHYVELPRFRENPPAYKYVFRNNLREAYLGELAKTSPDHFSPDLFQQNPKKRRYVALHHFHPHVVKTFHENPLTSARRHKVPISITAFEMKELGMECHSENQIVSMSGKPTGGYYFVPHYSIDQAHDDLKELIKLQRQIQIDNRQKVEEAKKQRRRKERKRQEQREKQKLRLQQLEQKLEAMNEIPQSSSFDTASSSNSRVIALTHQRLAEKERLRREEEEEESEEHKEDDNDDDESQQQEEHDVSHTNEDDDDDDDDDVVMTAFEKFRQMSIKSPSTPKPNAATTGGNGNDNNHSISPFNSTHSAPAPISSSFASPKPHTPINSYSQHTPRKSPFTTPQQQHQRKHTYGSRRFSSSSASISSASSATSSLVPPAFQATMLASPPIFSKQPLKRDGSQSTTPRRLNHHRWSSLGSTTNTPTGSFHSISTNGTITTDEEDEDDMDDATDEKVTSTPLSAYRDRFRRSSSVADLVNNFSSPKPTGDTKISTPKTAPTTTTSSPMRRKIKFERKPDHDSNVPSLFRAPPLAFDTKPKQKNEPKTVYKDGKKFTVTATSNSRRLGGTVKKATVTKKMMKKSSASSTDAIKKKSASKDKKSSSRSTSKSNKSSSEPPGVVSFTTKPSDYEDSFVKLNSEPIVPKLSPRLTWKEQQQKRRQAQKGGSATPKQRHSSSSSMSSRDLPKSKKRISKRSSTTAMPSNTSSNRFAKNSNKIDTPSGRASVVMLNEKAPQIQQRPTTPTKLSKESVSNIFKNTDAHSLSKPCPFTTTKKAIKKQKPLKSALRRKTALSTTTATINVTFSAEIETTHTVQDTRKIPGVSFESLFYTDEELARFRHEQFCEEIGVDPDEY